MREVASPRVRTRAWRRRWRIAVLAAAAAMVSALPAAAQDVTEASLKAAFLYNLAKFTDWPADVLPPAAPLVMCVAGDATLAQALDRTVRDRLVMGHPVRVERVPLDGSPRGCHLLYAGGFTTAQIASLVAAARGTPTLTVVDVDATRPPGVVHLFVESGKLRFNLDHGLAKRSRLQLNANFIRLAKRVYDDPGGGAP